MKYREATVINRLDDRTLRVRWIYFLKWPKLGKIVSRKRDFLVHSPKNISFQISEKIKLKPIAKVSKKKSFLALKIN